MQNAFPRLPFLSAIRFLLARLFLGWSRADFAAIPRPVFQLVRESRGQPAYCTARGFRLLFGPAGERFAGYTRQQLFCFVFWRSYGDGFGPRVLIGLPFAWRCSAGQGNPFGLLFGARTFWSPQLPFPLRSRFAFSHWLNYGLPAKVERLTNSVFGVRKTWEQVAREAEAMAFETIDENPAVFGFWPAAKSYETTEEDTADAQKVAELLSFVDGKVSAALFRYFGNVPPAPRGLAPSYPSA